MNRGAICHDATLLSENEIRDFLQGNHLGLSEKLGSHLQTQSNKEGVRFAVWAPHAEQVSVIGDFNAWSSGQHLLRRRDPQSGIWEGFVPGLRPGALYKYHIASGSMGYAAEKGDPFAFRWETPPGMASMVWDLSYSWNDANWMQGRAELDPHQRPYSIYEVHLDSWRRAPEEGGRPLTYREQAHQLAEYAYHMGYTHVQLLPVMESPAEAPWDPTLGYFAPTSRYGSPQDFMYLIDHLHQRGIGVLLDWVPSYFAKDGAGFACFDGTYLYEKAPPSHGRQTEQNGLAFYFGRPEVRSFLLSSALFWLRTYHVDGLCLRGLEAMLRLDYDDRPGHPWIPKRPGGTEDLDAASFLRDLNTAVQRNFPDVHTIAEESSAWPLISRPTSVGGLGFDMKWNLGWSHDTLGYFDKDPLYRGYHHDQVTRSLDYAFSENFVLPLSHEEVILEKGSLTARLPGDDWQKMANLRALFGYMFAHPGKKLVFMGIDFAQWSAWQPRQSLDWHLLEYAPHQGMQRWVRDLNHLYREQPALHQLDFDASGFEWMDFHDVQNSVISFVRRGRSEDNDILAICNFTPVPRTNYRVPVPGRGWWQEILNSDATTYGGSGMGNFGGTVAAPIRAGAKFHSLSIVLPPLGVLFFTRAKVVHE